jgi:hypothetical protein
MIREKAPAIIIANVSKLEKPYRYLFLFFWIDFAFFARTITPANVAITYMEKMLILAKCHGLVPGGHGCIPNSCLGTKNAEIDVDNTRIF